MNNPIPINIATEDEVSETALVKIIDYVGRYAIGSTFRRGGFGYLKRTLPGWNTASRGKPFVVLTDLDNAICPIALLRSWLIQTPHPNLIFRVAVKEIESWLLADRTNLSNYLLTSQDRIPTIPDMLPDPKKVLIEASKKSRSSEIRSRMVPKFGSTAKQGPDYNTCISTFIRGHWDIKIAMDNSPSLKRTVRRLSIFDPIWS